MNKYKKNTHSWTNEQVHFAMKTRTLQKKIKQEGYETDTDTGVPARVDAEPCQGAEHLSDGRTFDEFVLSDDVFLTLYL